MKKFILIAVLILLIISSIVTGTLAVYSADLDEISGETVAKEFAFSAVGDDRYLDADMKIAPGESVTYNFSASNFKTAGNAKIVSEVNMLANFKISIEPIINQNGTLTDIQPIKYLIASVYDRDTDAKLLDLNLTDGVSTPVKDTLSVKYTANTAVTRNFKVVVTWVSHEDDILYSSAKSALKINASAVQITEETVVQLPNGAYMMNRSIPELSDLSEAAGKLVYSSSDVTSNAAYTLAAFNYALKNWQTMAYAEKYSSLPNFGVYEGYDVAFSNSTDGNTKKKAALFNEVFTTLTGSNTALRFSDFKVVFTSSRKSVGGIYIKYSDNTEIIFFADGTTVYNTHYRSSYKETTYLAMMQNGKFQD